MIILTTPQRFIISRMPNSTLKLSKATKGLLIGSLFLLSSTAFSQNDTINRHLFGIRPTVNQLLFLYQYQPYEGMGFYLNLGYQLRYNPSYTYGGAPFRTGWAVKLASYGFVGELGLVKSTGKRFNFHGGIYVQSTRVDRGVNDYGFFGGSTTSEYEVFWREDVRIGAKGIVEVAAIQLIRPFAGMGIRYNGITRHMIIGGTYDNRVPSDEIITQWYVLPVLHFGVNVYPFAIKSEAR